jgi:hypothetical protein
MRSVGSTPDTRHVPSGSSMGVMVSTAEALFSNTVSYWIVTSAAAALLTTRPDSALAPCRLHVGPTLEPGCEAAIAQGLVSFRSLLGGSPFLATDTRPIA